MDTNDVVLTVLRDLEIDTDGVDEATRLREDLQVDSTELVEIAVAIERRAPVALDTEAVLALKTVGDLLTYVDNAPPREQATAPQPG